MTDENNNAVVEYKDKNGRVILKKAQLGTITSTSPYANWLCTFYVYDDLGQLRFVIPPKAVTQMAGSSWQLSASMINDLCFRYEYDSRQRMIAKKVPGSGWVNMVYDKRDRLAFTQDARMYNHTPKQWMYTLYDQLNRPVQTGIMEYGGSVTDLQTYVNGLPEANTLVNTDGSSSSQLTSNLLVSNRQPGTVSYYATNTIEFNEGFTSEDGAEFTAEIINGSPSRFSSQQTINYNSIPGGTNYTPLTLTYYDDYTWTSKTYQTNNNSKLDQGLNAYEEPLPVSQNGHTVGLVTGIRVRAIEDPNNLSSGNWLETASFYDDKARTIQVISDNYKGGQDILTSRYDFTGKIVSSYQVHNNPQGNMINLRIELIWNMTMQGG